MNDVEQLEQSGGGQSSRTCALAGEFNYEAPPVRPYPKPVAFIRKHMFKLFLLVAFAGSLVFMLIAYFAMQPHDDSLLFLSCSHQWKSLFKYMSIPLVSIIFTWWHVWLGIKMCFYPVEFVGCSRPKLYGEPIFGWQGIVPRRARVMAERSCDIMIGSLITVEEIIDRIHAEEFFEELDTVLSKISGDVLARVAQKNWPRLWNNLPMVAKQELQTKVMEESQKMFHPVVGDLKRDINKIVDIKQMSVDILCENKPLMVQMFQDIGNREFTFIQHVAAVMGCILGIIQMFSWILINDGNDEPCGPGDHAVRCWIGYIILPVSGLVIGIFTNWLGITMIFRPVEPHIICGGYVNIQGVFLKRQPQVAKELTKVICKELVTAEKMLTFVLKSQGTIDKVLEIYQEHMNAAFDKVMSHAQSAAPIFMGPRAVPNMKDDVIQLTLECMKPHQKSIEEFMDRKFDLEDTLAHRLSRLHPARFEGMLHPVFQEDEWMVLLLGGVLGVIVGLLQAFALGS